MLILDERALLRPMVGTNGRVTASREIHFSNLQHVGLGLKWMPKCFIKDLSINPNLIGFWSAKRIHKYVPNTVEPWLPGTLSLTEYARNFMGTEANIWTTCRVVTDLTFFLNFAVFVPGGYYTDMKGVPVTREVFKFIVQDDRNDLDSASLGLGDDTAFHLNIGIEYKF
jgi:hypothetical protein